METEKRMHWYCFSYVGAVDSGLQHGCSYVGYESENITHRNIKENKRNAGMKDDAVLVSVTRLGYMTKQEFTA